MPAAEETFFLCQRCTACCKIEGEVVLTDEETQKIAEYLGQPLYQFVREFTDLRENRMGLTLRDKPGTTECVMLEGENCRINPVKPDQCRPFPNRWNFPGWREVCEAKEVRRER